MCALNSSRHSTLALATALVVGTLVWTGAQNDAHAQVNAGIDGGFAYRSSTPKLNLGWAYGAHAEAKPVDTLAIGAYYLVYDLPVDGTPNTVKSAGFRSLGGRARFTLPIPDSNLQPYGYLGLGYVWATYPVEDSGFNPDIMGNVPVQFIQRDGHYLEIPIGIGLGYKIGNFFMLSADISLRPGVGFGGDAYKGHSPVDETKIGMTGLIGASMDL
jgi:opacity protein-like surface antigen